MAYSEEIKKKVLSEVEAGKSVAEVSNDYNIATSTIYRWRKTITGAKTIDKKFTKSNDEEERVFTDVKMLRKQGRYEEAEKLGDKYPDSAKIQSQISQDLSEEELAKEILRRIYNNSDSMILEDIEHIENKWLKFILNSALAEKTNLKEQTQQFIKQLRRQENIKQEYKIVNALEQRLEQKGKIFDVGFYDNLIGIIVEKQNPQLILPRKVETKESATEERKSDKKSITGGQKN